MVSYLLVVNPHNIVLLGTAAKAVHCNCVSRGLVQNIAAVNLKRNLRSHRMTLMIATWNVRSLVENAGDERVQYVGRDQMKLYLILMW